MAAALPLKAELGRLIYEHMPGLLPSADGPLRAIASPMHETDFSHEHSETLAEHAAIAQSIWTQDNLLFTTVGIDIGSSTSHLLFAKVALQRKAPTGMCWTRTMTLLT